MIGASTSQICVANSTVRTSSRACATTSVTRPTVSARAASMTSPVTRPISPALHVAFGAQRNSDGWLGCPPSPPVSPRARHRCTLVGSTWCSRPRLRSRPPSWQDTVQVEDWDVQFVSPGPRLGRSSSSRTGWPGPSGRVVVRFSHLLEGREDGAAAAAEAGDPSQPTRRSPATPNVANQEKLSTAAATKGHASKTARTGIRAFRSSMKSSITFRTSPPPRSERSRPPRRRSGTRSLDSPQVVTHVNITRAPTHTQVTR